LRGKGSITKGNEDENENRNKKENARGYALKLLKEIEEGAYANIVLNRLLSRISLIEEERSFLTELFYGVLQRLNTLDWILSLYLTSPLDKLTPWIRNILRLGVFQLLYLKRIPASAAVDESVKLALRFGHKGVAGLVNAVLRKVDRLKEEIPWPSRSGDPFLYLSLVYSFPLWIVRRWIGQMGLDEAEKLCQANNAVPPLSIRTNTLKTTPGRLKVLLEEEGIKADPCRYAPEGLVLHLTKRLTSLDSFQEGLFQIQGEASMLVAPLVNPRAGERVLDLCSAPGGKTLHMAMLMGNKGRILAADMYPHRLELLEKMMKRHNIKIVRTEKLDGRSISSSEYGSYDRVLLDVPCSGLGVVRRKGELKWRRKEEDIFSLARLQADLLRCAFKALKPGGVLVYSACSTEPEETREIIYAFLQEESSASLALLAPLLPEELRSQEKEEGTIYFYPHKHGLDGFFMARIRKKGND
jgi:16S rRNA (cytosine967-C5)-methyltransferase